MSDAFLQRPQVTLATANALVEAALGRAREIGVAVAVVVNDGAGAVVASARMDDAPLGAMRLATDKAYTATLWQIPSADLGQSSQPGGSDWGITSTEGGRVVVYAGGLPIFCGEALAGAIGVSGATSDEDLECARAALATVLPTP